MFCKLSIEFNAQFCVNIFMFPEIKKSSFKRGYTVFYNTDLLEKRRSRVVRAARLWCITFLCQPTSKLVPLTNQGRIIQRKKRDGLRLSSAVSIRLWETFT